MISENFNFQEIDPSLFRMYDIRGIVAETFTQEVVYYIGKVFGTMVQEHGAKQLVLSRDGRWSSPSLATALKKGVLSSGCDVVDIGMAATPLLYYTAHLLDGHAGLMVTGSHNPPEYNGIKMVIDGRAVCAEEIQTIYQRLLKQDFQEGTGKYSQYHLTDQYLSQIAHSVKVTRPLKIVVDAGNGVAGLLAPSLYRSLGCEVHELFCEVDGHFPNHEADPSQEKNLQTLINTVRELKADVGLAFDGDGDRLGVVTNEGTIIWPDRLLMMFVKKLLQDHPQAKIIFDVKCTDLLNQFIRSLGGNPIIWKTGHSFIKAKMAEEGALLAGEMSGHFFFKDRWFGFDDAIYAGARFLEILSQQNQTCHDLFSTFPNSVNTPEIKVAVSEAEKFTLMTSLQEKIALQQGLELITIDGLRVHFEQGWGLVRASNTTANLILRFEAFSHEALSEIQDFFRDLMHSVKPGWVLPF